MEKVIFIAIMVAVAFLEVGGDILFKKWSLAGQLSLLGLGLAVYLLAAAGWAFSLKYETLSRAIFIFTIMNLFFGVLAGIIFFGDQLTLIQKIGMTLGIISIILIEL
jgi:drug/metabolite transporter (DMT)-like permease